MNTDRLADVANSIFRVPLVRYGYMRMRLRPLVKLRGIRTLDGHGSVGATVDHNLKSLRSHNARSEKLLLASMCIEDLRSAKALVIGCRNEEELFMFRSYGITDVTAVDLLSYSPHITVGDMHHLPYDDDSFDYVFCAYTLVYSQRPREAAEEIVRVCRPGGHVAIAIEYVPWDRREEIQKALLGYTIMPDEKLDCVEDILNLFGESVDHVEVRYDAEMKRHHDTTGLIANPSPVLTVFSLAKAPFTN